MSCAPAVNGTVVELRLPDGVRGLRDVAHRAREVLGAADRREMHALAVDGDLELVRQLEALHRAEIGLEVA